MNQENKQNKPNWFVRSLIICMGLILVSIIIFNFFIKEKGAITYGLILIICLILVLFLSEIFDNIKFLKILSLSKSVEEKTNEVKELKTEKQNLLNLLITNISINKNSQIMGFSASEVKELFKIFQADPNRSKEEYKAKEEEINKDELKNSKRKIDLRKLEEFAFKKYKEFNNLIDKTIQQQVEFISSDSISSYNPIFDGYLKRDDEEVFFEVKLQRTSLIIRDALYLRLNNIYNYNRLTNSKAYLQVLIIELKDDNRKLKFDSTEEKIKKYFQPAIEKGLIRINLIQLAENEENELYKS